MLSDFNPVFYSRCRYRWTRVYAVCPRHVRVRDLFEKAMSVSAIWKFVMSVSVSAIQNFVMSVFASMSAVSQFVISVSASADIGGQALSTSVRVHRSLSRCWVELSYTRNFFEFSISKCVDNLLKKACLWKMLKPMETWVSLVQEAWNILRSNCATYCNMIYIKVPRNI